MASGDETHLSTDMMRMMWQLATGNRFATVCIVIAKNKMITINIKSPRTTNKTLETELFPRVARTQRTSLSLSHTRTPNSSTANGANECARERIWSSMYTWALFSSLFLSFSLSFALSVANKTRYMADRVAHHRASRNIPYTNSAQKSDG